MDPRPSQTNPRLTCPATATLFDASNCLHTSTTTSTSVDEPFVRSIVSQYSITSRQSQLDSL